MLPTMLALTAQTRQNTAPPTQIYTSTPQFVSTNGVIPELTIHGVTVYLGINESKVESLTLFHNTSNNPAQGNMTLVARSNGYGFSELRNLKATWNKTPVEFKVQKVDRVAGITGDVLIAPREIITASVPVVIPPKGTAALTLSLIQPTAKYGLDKAARQFVYSLPQFDGRPEQFRIALKYSPEVVWKPLQALSSVGKWQVGDNGAYLKMDGVEQSGGQAIFRFYPKTF